ncbi:MAG: hypothetical protein U0235_26535, partial [Polyangiaceae bacterium]
MRRSPLPIAAVLATALVACAGTAHDAGDGSDQALGEAPPDTSHFAMTPGRERIKQHKGSGDTTENQKQSLDVA